jgi:RNA polymerase sigma factor (sigma-70 family)
VVKSQIQFLKKNSLTADKELLEGCKKMDERSCQLLYTKYSSWLYAVCLRYVTNKEDAKDVLQEAFILIYKNLHQYSGEKSFEAWIKRITVNTALATFRKKNEKVLARAQDIEDLVLLDVDLLNHLNAEELTFYIQRLSPGRKQVFNAYFVEGFSHKEIAEQLGISEGTSKSQLHDAKKELKKAIENEYAISKR